MDIKESMQNSLSEQINAEFFSAYIYLAMSNYFHQLNLTGFAHWMEKQAAEELSHGMKLYKYIIGRNGFAGFKEITQPNYKWESPLHAFEEVVKHEQHVTDKINKLMDQAIGEKDHATTGELQWFIREQVEEESTANSIYEKIKMVGTSTQGLVLIDRELALR
jgi:ferritin